jgi:hypothetical protein
VHRTVRDANALGPCGGRADDRVVPAQIERFERQRIERRERAKEAAAAGDALQERRVHALRRDDVGQRRFVKRGVDRCLRIGGGDVGEDTFGTTALVQVIVDQRDAQGYVPSPRPRGSTVATVER